MSKSIILKGLVLILFICIAIPVAAEEKSDEFFISGQGTYGSYSNSKYRYYLYSERLTLSYAKGDGEFGAGLTAADSHIFMNLSKPKIDGIDVGGTLFLTPKISGGNYIGGKISLLRIQSSDKNSNDSYIPYVSFIFKPEDLSHYFDVGYARTTFMDTTANQFTLTGGIALFDYWVWSSTRLYLINLSQMISNKDKVFAVEERFTYFVVPQKFNITLNAMLGQKIYAYNPDSNSSYNLSDIHNGSIGISANYNISERFIVFADISSEFYKFVEYGKSDNDYYIVYYTGGISIKLF
jgi:hypothetical protein